MKKIYISLFVALAFVACRKNRIENNACKTPHVEHSVDSASIIIPNIFTPNSDNLNDIFAIRTVNIKSIVITVYNKKNDIIWTESVSSNGERYLGSWNGANWAGNSSGEIVEETYKYTVEARTESGQNLTAEGEVAVVTDFRYCLKNISNCYFPAQAYGGSSSETFRECR